MAVRNKSNSSRGGTFLTATGAPVASQGTLNVSFQLVDVHGVEINVRATFELLPVRRPILSVSRLVEKGFAVVMAEAVGEANVPWTRRLPYNPTEDEKLARSVTHLPFRAWCSQCVKGLARDWPRRSDYGPPPDIPMVAMDFCFVNTGSGDDVLTILAMKEKSFQSVGATVLLDKSASEFAVATTIGYLDFW